MSRNRRGSIVGMVLGNDHKILEAVKKGDLGKLQRSLRKVTFTPDGLKSDDNGYNALTYAAKLGREDMVEAMLEMIEPDKLDGKGRTALCVAAIENQPKVAQVLLAHGAVLDLECKMENGTATATQLAIFGYCDEVLEVLGKAAGQWVYDALKAGDLSKVQQLLDRPGMNPNYQDLTGWTPLHLAVKDNNEQVVEWLSEKGADGSLKNKIGKSAIDIANDMGNKAMAKMIEDGHYKWMEKRQEYLRRKAEFMKNKKKTQDGKSEGNLNTNGEAEKTPSNTKDSSETPKTENSPAKNKAVEENKKAENKTKRQSLVKRLTGNFSWFAEQKKEEAEQDGKESESDQGNDKTASSNSKEEKEEKSDGKKENHTEKKTEGKKEKKAKKKEKDQS